MLWKCWLLSTCSSRNPAVRLLCPYTTCSCVRGISPGCDPSEQCPVPGLPSLSAVLQQPQLPAQSRGAAGGWLHSTHISPPRQGQGSGGCHPLQRHPQQASARCPHPSWLSQCEPLRLPTSSAAPCWASYGLVAVKIAGKRNRNPLLLSLLIMGTCKGYAGVAMHGETNSIQALGRAG